MSQVLNISIYQQGNFYRVPKVLIQGEKYKNLSSDAKLLYAVYQDRAELSIQNNWTDTNGDIYFIYAIAEVCFFMGWGKDKVIKVKRELIRFQLLSEIRQGRNKVNKTYLHLVDTATNIRKFISKKKIQSAIQLWIAEQKLSSSEIDKSEVENSCLQYLVSHFNIYPQYVDKFLKDYQLKVFDIYKEHQKVLVHREVEKNDFQNRVEKIRNSKIPPSRILENRLLEDEISDSNDTDKRETNINKEEEGIKGKSNIIQEEILLGEIHSILSKTPELSPYLQSFKDERQLDIWEEYHLVDGLDACWQILIFEKDNHNLYIQNEVKLKGLQVVNELFHEGFKHQFEYTRSYCRQQDFFIQYFISGMKSRLENKIRENKWIE